MRGLGVLIAAAIVVGGCGGGGGGGDTEAGGRSCKSLLPVSVSVVNGWPGVDPEAYAAELADSCLSLVEIEALPWFDRAGPCDSRNPRLCTDPFLNERRALFAAMAERGISVFVTAHNANAYGPRLMSRAAWDEHIRGIAADAEVTGADVWLSPISEPWTWESPEAEARARLARSIWNRKFVLPDRGANRRFGRPYWTGMPYDLLEVHPCSLAATEASLSPDTLTVTDCTPVLNPGGAAALDLASIAADLGAPLIFYDHFATQPDLATIRALKGLQ